MARPRSEASSEREPGPPVSSEAVEDFIGLVPGWLLRRGNTILLVVFVALVVGAWVLEYPDVVSAPVTITTESPPAPVVARSSGRLGQLWVEDGERVERGRWLAVVENAASTEDVRALATMLEAFAHELDDPANFDAAHYRLGEELELGELQVEYAEFVAAWVDLRASFSDPYYTASGERIATQLETSTSLTGSIRGQQRHLSEDLEQAKRELRAAARLADEGVIPTRELDAAKALVRERERELEGSEVELLRGDLDRATLDRARLELAHELRERRRERLRAVHDAYAALSRGYERWRRDYLLVSPMAGRVSLDRVWSEQQWIAESEEVMTVIPIHDELVGRVTLAQLNSGKVEVGQRVLLKLDGYPFREYGVVEGVVASVPAIARDGVYLVTLDLPAGLTTSHGRTLELRHDMGGTAEIIAAERRLLERLFHQIRSLLRQS